MGERGPSPPLFLSFSLTFCFVILRYFMMTLKHTQHKNSNRKCRSTFYICKLLQQLLSFNKKNPTRFGKALKKSAGCIIFVKKERKCWIRNPLPTLMTDYGKEVLILLKRRPELVNNYPGCQRLFFQYFRFL